MTRFGTRIFYAPDGAGGGGAPAFDQAATIATIPEPLRGHEAFKDVKDLGGFAKAALNVATDYHGKFSMTQKPLADQLPEDIRTDPAFKDIKDLAGLARGYHGAVKKIGVPPDQLIRLPTGPDDKEGRAALFDRLGRPKEAAAYKFDAPQGKIWSDTDKAFQTAIATAAHAVGLNQEQLDGLRGVYEKFGGELETAQNAAKATALLDVEKKLKTEFGAAYDSKMADAGLALQHFGKELKLGDALQKEIMGANPAERPAIAKLFAHIGAQLRSDKVIGGGGGGGTGALSPTEAQQQLNAQMADAGFKAAYFDKAHPKHADAVAERARLYAIGYPNQTA